MASSTLVALMRLEGTCPSDSDVRRPSLAAELDTTLFEERAQHRNPEYSPSEYESSREHNGSHPECNIASQASTAPTTSTQPALNATPNELEMSRPPIPENTGPSSMIHTWRDPSINKWRVLSACVAAFGQGFNDSAPGALLPYIEQHYGIDYAEVATIFIANAVGFIAAAFSVHILDRRLGRARTLLLCEMLNAIAFATMIIPPPFAVFALGYFITGYSLATTLSLNNVFCANTEPATTVLGAFHGAYGVGGTTAPLIATAMVTSGIEFSRFFALLLGIRILSGFCLGSTFWHWETDTSVEEISLEDMNMQNRGESANESAASAVSQRSPKSSTLLPALKRKVTLTAALFIFAYQGAEVSISGWVISFLITVRHGEPSRVGYVTAGFWAGITLGRLVLSPIAQRAGEKAFTYGLLVGAIAFEVAVWRLESVIGDSVFIALLGLLLGPIYPCATVVFTRLLPRNLQHTAIAFISSAGSSGGAVAPFLTGILAQAAGTWVLHPIAISLYVVMVVCWTLLPRIPKKSD